MVERYSEHIWTDDAGHLRVEEADCVELAERFGTPLYVTSENQIRANYRRFYGAFARRYPRVAVLFANKANNSLAVRRIFNQEGAGGDCFGAGELYLALLSGADPNKLCMNGSNKTEEELTMAIQAGVAINPDCLEELDTIIRAAERLGKRARISPRLKLGLYELDKTEAHRSVGPELRAYKAGMHYDDVAEAVRRALASPRVELLGLHTHVGRATNDPLLFAVAVREYVAAVAKIRDAFGWEPGQLDLGGGFAFGRPEGHGPANADRTAPGYEVYAEVVCSTLKEELGRHRLSTPLLVLEPGRSLSSNIGILLARVGVVKEWPGERKWVNVDASWNHLMMIPQSAYYYHIVLANRRGGATETVDVVGPLCWADVLARDRALPPVRRGDLLAFLDTGSYAECKASTYNVQPRPAGVLVCGRQAAVITERETVQDVISRYRIPPWLMGTPTETPPPASR